MCKDEKVTDEMLDKIFATHKQISNLLDIWVTRPLNKDEQDEVFNFVQTMCFLFEARFGVGKYVKWEASCPKCGDFNTIPTKNSHVRQCLDCRVVFNCEYVDVEKPK